MAVLSLGYLHLRTPEPRRVAHVRHRGARPHAGLGTRCGRAVLPLGRPSLSAGARAGGRGVGVGDRLRGRRRSRSAGARGHTRDGWRRGGARLGRRGGAPAGERVRVVRGSSRRADRALPRSDPEPRTVPQTPLVSGFVTGEMGLGHVVISGPRPGRVDRLLPRSSRLPPAEHVVPRRDVDGVPRLQPASPQPRVRVRAAGAGAADGTSWSRWRRSTTWDGPRTAAWTTACPSSWDWGATRTTT